MTIDYRKADLTPRQTAMLDFALKVSQAAYAVNDANFETLRGYGLTDADTWEDIGAVAAFFAMSNRLANMTRLRPNDEFYLLGRIPKQR